MNMKKAYFVSAALLMSAAVSFGQNFNPTVEVTNTYQAVLPRYRSLFLE